VTDEIMAEYLLLRAEQASNWLKLRAARERLGGSIRSARLAKKLSMRELARRSRVSAAFISDLERGLRGVSESALRRIRRAL
jgi:hypothetical protein